MRYLVTVPLAVVIVVAGGLVADAQQNTQDENTGTGAAGNISGQSGQSENFLIQRDPNAFVGGSATGFFGQSATGGTGLSGLGGIGGLGTAGAFGGLNSFGRGNTGFGNQAGSQSAGEPKIRFRMTLGFSHPRPAGTKLSATLARRLARISQLPSARSVAVTMEDRTAVLAGEVDSEREKTLIEKLAMMEPGVSAVRNELTVKPTSELLPQPAATN